MTKCKHIITHPDVWVYQRPESHTILSFIAVQGPLQKFFLLLDVSQAIVGVAQIWERGGHIAVVRPKLSFLAVTAPQQPRDCRSVWTVHDGPGFPRPSPDEAALALHLRKDHTSPSQARWIWSKQIIQIQNDPYIDGFDIQLDWNEWTIPECVVCRMTSWTWWIHVDLWTSCATPRLCKAAPTIACSSP